MPSLATFFKDHCVPCGEVMVHNSDGCTFCKTQRAAPIARDIASLTFGAQSERVADLRRARNRAAVSIANRNRPRDHTRFVEGSRAGRQLGERPRTIERDVQILARIAQGMTNRATLARVIGITPQAIGDAIRRTYARLAVPPPAHGENNHSVLIETARVRGVIA